MHQAEYRAKYPKKKDEPTGAPLILDGGRRWVADRSRDLSQEGVGASFARDGGDGAVAGIDDGIGRAGSVQLPRGRRRTL